MGRGILDDVPGTAGGGLVDRAEEVAGSVGERQADHRAARRGILAWRTVPLPVVAAHQSRAAGWDHRRPFVQDLEDVHAAPLGLALLMAPERAAIPVQDRTGGRLAGLEGVQALDGRIRI